MTNDASRALACLEDGDLDVAREILRAMQGHGTMTQILIFNPRCAEKPQPTPTRNQDEQEADRQRFINLELERVQDDGAKVRDIVLGTNNFVYAVIEYPRTGDGAF